MLAALAFSLSLPAFSQEPTGDPFLDAMLSDQATEETPKTESTPAPEQVRPAEEEEAPEQQPAPQAPVQTHLVSAADRTTLVDDATVTRELGPQTGLFTQDAAYEGKRITRVDIRYLNKRTVPDARLYDVIQTRAGSEYSAMRINNDLERLINRGLVHPDTRVAAEPQGNGVRVIFEVKSASVMGGIGFTGNKKFTERELREAISEANQNSSLGSGRVLNDRELSQAQTALIKTYQDAG